MTKQIHFSLKRIKSIPSGFRIAWLLTAAFCCMLLAQVCNPPARTPGDTVETVIRVDAAALRPRRFGMSLTLRDGENTYSVSYPMYKTYADAVEKELLTGEVTTVHARIEPRRTIFMRLSHRYVVVDLRCSDAVFYDFGTEIHQRLADYAVLCVITALLWLFWLAGTTALAYLYKVVKIDRKKRTQRK